MSSQCNKSLDLAWNQRAYLSKFPSSVCRYWSIKEFPPQVVHNFECTSYEWAELPSCQGLLKSPFQFLGGTIDSHMLSPTACTSSAILCNIPGALTAESTDSGVKLSLPAPPFNSILCIEPTIEWVNIIHSVQSLQSLGVWFYSGTVPLVQDQPRVSQVLWTIVWKSWK